jgi:hypothetical protein
LCEAIFSATFAVFAATKAQMEGFDTRRHKGQSGARSADAALARVARAESISAFAKPNAFGHGARSCYSPVTLARKPSGASVVSPRALNHLENFLRVRCSEALPLLFACLTGENTRRDLWTSRQTLDFSESLARVRCSRKFP